MYSVSTARGHTSSRAVLTAPRYAPYRAAVLAALAVGVDEAFNPTSTHLPLCPLHALTGIWCPFCGGLRSAYELTRLHLSAALHDNVVFVFSLPVLAALWIDWIVRSRSDQGRRPIPRAATAAVVLVLVAFTIVRNLPIGAGLRAG